MAGEASRGAIGFSSKKQSCFYLQTNRSEIIINRLSLPLAKLPSTNTVWKERDKADSNYDNKKHLDYTRITS